MIIAFIVLALTLALLWLYLTNTVIGVTHLTIRDKNLPSALDGLTIAHISDLHNTLFKGENGLSAKLQASKADIIVVTGDLVDSRHTEPEPALAAMRQAVSIAPVYYVTGNHESRLTTLYPTLEKELGDIGVHILHDEAVLWERDGQSICLVGLDDPSYRHTMGNADATALQVLTELVSSDQYTIVLSHRPELFAQYCAAGANLVFCGHAHGGQVRIPFVGAVLAPNQGFFPTYTEGTYTDSDTTMVVSRGLGNSLCPIRVNNPPELVVVTLQS